MLETTLCHTTVNGIRHITRMLIIRVIIRENITRVVIRVMAARDIITGDMMIMEGITEGDPRIQEMTVQDVEQAICAVICGVLILCVNVWEEICVHAFKVKGYSICICNDGNISTDSGYQWVY